jgi:hypothetical protein
LDNVFEAFTRSQPFERPGDFNARVLEGRTSPAHANRPDDVVAKGTVLVGFAANHFRNEFGH